MEDEVTQGRGSFDWIKQLGKATGGGAIPSLQALLGILGVALYAVGRLASDRFYGTLHVTPDEVGLTFVTLLLPAVLVACLLLSAIILAIPIWLVTDDATKRAGAWLGIHVSGLGGRLLAGLVSNVGQLLWMVPVVIYVVTGSFVLAALSWTVLMTGLAIADLGESSVSRRRYLAFACLLFSATLIVVALLASQNLARQAQDGKEVSANVGLQLPAIRADRVLVRPVDKLPDSLESKCMLRLGAADGATVLYDYDRDIVWRVATDSVLLEGKC
jgi:hypothetical protein